MEESYGEGIANHTDPELCRGIRKGVREALAGELTGEVLSLENVQTLGR